MFGWITLAIIILLLILIFYPGNLFRLAMWSVRRSAGLACKRVAVGRHQIVYLEGGTGPHLVLLHGFGANKDNWNRFAKHFTSSYHVIIPDLPGFGDSSYFPDEEYDVESQVERLIDFFKALKLDEFHLAGNSMGGQIAVAYTIKRPGRVLSLTLFDAAGIQEDTPSEMSRLLEKGINPLVVKEASDYSELLKFVFFNPPEFPAGVMKGLAADAVRHTASNERIFQQLLGKWVQLDPLLPRIESPALIIWGDKDRVFDVSCADRFERSLKYSKKVVFENCGHMPMLEMPDKSAEVVRDFIGSIRY
jgi:abhydrolase domain-containing protein 6